MARKRKAKRIDEFLRSRQQGQEVVLKESARHANLIFRLVVTAVLVFLLLLLLNIGRQKLHEQVGFAGILVMVTTLGVLVINRIQPALFQSTAKFNQFVLLIVLTVSLSWGMFEVHWPPFLLPLPALAMIAGLAYRNMVAILLCGGVASYLALLYQATLLSAQPNLHEGFNPFVLAISLSLGAVASVLGVRQVRKQSRPVLVGLKVGIVQALAVLCFKAIAASNFTDLDLRGWLLDPGFALLGGLVSGCIVTSLLPQIELAFGVLTERRLLELADPNNKLLRVLRERAPGTFQHTLGVQQLAHDATEAIGGNVLLADAGAWYHDVGKIYKPEYFAENMGKDKSIHDQLRPSMSKLIIMSHVKEGIILAREEKLPQQIIDMIPMHHGTTVVEFFFHKARQEEGEEEENSTEDTEYRYPGPKPTFPEAGILMLADSVEAIAKSLLEPTQARFREIARDMIRKRIFDGQLDECQLTMADLYRIEESFEATLTNIYHGRVEYPELETDSKTEEIGEPAPPPESDSDAKLEAT
ncbi:MAG: HDIG domain-containing metalloprotein [Planctomycetota bacterium]|nr:HDIG domain-containing metalloprotein [Planctomycetota bacterium]